MTDVHDIVIIGAGPAGSTLAYFLASNGLDVLLLDKAAFPRDKTCGDALSPRALHVLRKMGLFEPVRRAGFQIEKVAFYSPNGKHVTMAVPAYDNLPNFSVVMPRYKFDNILLEHAVSANAQFQSKVNVIDVMREAESIVGIRADSPDGPIEIRSRFTVIATGAATSLLERAELLAHLPEYSRAARTYYEGVQGLSDTIEFHFDAVPLPGYGWVFPISPTAANVGAGYYAPAGRIPTKKSPRHLLDEFISSSKVSDLLKGARMTAPIKGYPLRFDFPKARIAFPGLGLVGEACGLVNPLTGEGIDYALESAETVAGFLIDVFNSSKSPQYVMEKYTQILQERFLRTFNALIRVRDWYLRPWMLNRYVSAALRNEEVALLLVNIGLGNIDPLKAFSLRNLVRIFWG
ncbi:MAG: geranylgeranyl reductase family protein [Chloroflexi bacterium]|nr:geranylgeranyl reductase family protein [Chloroflexota bacterium]